MRARRVMEKRKVPEEYAFSWFGCLKEVKEKSGTAWPRMVDENIYMKYS